MRTVYTKVIYKKLTQVKKSRSDSGADSSPPGRPTPFR